MGTVLPLGGGRFLFSSNLLFDYIIFYEIDPAL